jgi:putative thioredoxin
MTADPEKAQVFEVSEAEFDQRVVAASRERVVVVDFWAPWCAPCHMLAPVLERVVGEAAGRAVLAKVNLDTSPGLAGRFGIQAIPNVKVFRDGKVVLDLTGALPEPELRRRLSTVLPSPADDLVVEGDEARQGGSLTTAGEKYGRALELNPRHAAARLGLAELALQEGDLDRARDMALGIQEDAEEHEAAVSVLARVKFITHCREAGGEAVCAKRLEKEQHSLDALYDLACCLAAKEKYREALDFFLRILGQEKHYRDNAAKQAMVEIFSIVGQRSDIADEYRSQLAKVLY